MKAVNTDILSFNAENISFREVKKEIYLLNLDNGNFYFLNKSASLIFKLLKLNKKFNEIIKRLFNEYDIDKKTLEKDARRVISDFKKEKIFFESK